MTLPSDIAALKERLADVARRAAGRQAVIFGAGDAGVVAAALLQSMPFPVRAFVDNDASRNGQVRLGLPVFHPSTLIGQAAGTIVVVSSDGGYAAIRDQVRAWGYEEGVSCVPLFGPRHTQPPTPPAPPACHRRAEGGQLHPLTPDYFRARDAAVAPVIEAAFSGGDLDRALANPAFAAFDERVVEYPSAVDCLRRAAAAGPIDALDVGCVLNNAPVVPAVRALTTRAWFLNPSMERLAYPDRVGYLVDDVRRFDPPRGLCFDVVTCLSTLEHLGMDNQRYGGTKAETTAEDPAPERFAIAAVQSIVRLVKPGGRLLLSLPFGVFEYVYVYGRPHDPIYYTFDAPRLANVVASLAGFDCDVRVYRLDADAGWTRTSPADTRFPLYADGVPSCSGVAIVEAVRTAGLRPTERA
jgi:SAM-dependent methyltransferase